MRHLSWIIFAVCCLLTLSKVTIAENTRHSWFDLQSLDAQGMPEPIWKLWKKIWNLEEQIWKLENEVIDLRIQVQNLNREIPDKLKSLGWELEEEMRKIEKDLRDLNDRSVMGDYKLRDEITDIKRRLPSETE